MIILIVFFFILPYYYYYFRYVLQFSVEWKTSYLENMEGNSIMHGNGHATAVSGHWWGLQVDPVRSWTGFGFLFAMVIFSAPQASGSSSRRLLVLWALSEAWSVRRFFSMVFLHAQLSAILCACGLEGGSPYPVDLSHTPLNGKQLLLVSWWWSYGGGERDSPLSWSSLRLRYRAFGKGFLSIPFPSFPSSSWPLLCAGVEYSTSKGFLPLPQGQSSFAYIFPRNRASLLMA